MTELYALLATQTPGVRLARFEREPRETFAVEGRSRTLAPDALVELHDGQGVGLLAFVELDLGTMSHARLKVKAGAYAAYAAQAAWTERLERYCQAMEDWHITAAFEDQATGTTLERPGLQAALDLARQGQVELLLVYRVDRLSHKVRQLAAFGRAYVGTSAHGRNARYTYYACSTHACSTRYKYGRARCQGQRLSKDRLEHAVLAQLATIYRDGQLIGDVLTQAAEQASTDRPQHEQQLAGVRADIQNLERKIDR